MKFFTIVKQSINALMINKGRTFLTTLGIIIGIGSVIALISLGNGVQDSIKGQVSSLGATNLTVTSGARNAGDVQANTRRGVFANTQTLVREDLLALSNIQDSSITKVAGVVSGSQVFSIDGTDQRKTILGVSPEYFDIQSLEQTAGSLFSKEENETSQRKIVLGHALAQDLFKNEDAIGKTVKLQEVDFIVSGVLKEKAANALSDPNIQGFIPEKTSLEIFDTKNYGNFTVVAASENSIDRAKQLVEEALLKSHNISDPKLADFSVVSSEDLLSTIGQITSLLTSFLAGIAAISLVVGGIGIMNIMLVSVTERTREIGLRKAVGAKTSDIMLQFIVEAILLTFIGGLFGILLGYLVGSAASLAVPDLKAIITLPSILLAVGISSIVGLVFGVYPAAKAARLNPIDALRYE